MRAKYASDFILNGYDDWFLPSVNELVEIFNSSYSLFPKGQYKTSSESDETAGHYWLTYNCENINEVGYCYTLIVRTF